MADSPDDCALATAARQGDRLALAALLARQERSLYASAVAILGSTWDAHDAVQETLVEACAKIRGLRDPSKVRPWLARILVNKSRDILRARRRHNPVPDPEACPTREPFEDLNDDEGLREAMGMLSEERRLALALRFFLDLDYADMSAVTGWPRGTVKSRVYRALRELRCLIGRDGERPDG